MKNISATGCITELTPTLCTLFGVRIPARSTENCISSVMDYAQKTLGGEKVEKALVYAPDGIGNILFEKYPEMFAGLAGAAPLRTLLRATMPSVTPVCFGSMFSGALPEVHGIREYSKPVLSCDTIFDVFPAASKKVAIVSNTQCSIDMIFRSRNVDYFSFMEDLRPCEFTGYLLEKYDYDLIICYNPIYDSVMHKTSTDSPEALAACAKSIEFFMHLTKIFDKRWESKNRVSVFAPDHGAHNNEDGRGTHGKDIPEDMLVNHFYRVAKGSLN